MAQYLVEILGDKLELSNIKANESARLPSPETLKGKILVKVKSDCGYAIKNRGAQIECLKADWFSSVRGVRPLSSPFIIWTEQPSKAGEDVLGRREWKLDL